MNLSRREAIVSFLKINRSKKAEWEKLAPVADFHIGTTRLDRAIEVRSTEDGLQALYQGNHVALRIGIQGILEISLNRPVTKNSFLSLMTGEMREVL